jgi:hypothetical protein
MAIKEYVEKVIAEKNKTITDEVFLLIQNDRGFMQEYLRLVQEHNVQTVNQNIGKMVMTRYGLTSGAGRNNKPKSTLIATSHTKLQQKKA